jgi:Ca2+-transporting ATPase
VSPDVMSRKPRESGSKIIDKKMLTSILSLSFIMTIVVLILFFRYYKIDLVQARTWVFVLLVLLEMIRIWKIRSEYNLKFFSNKWLIWAVLWSIGFVLLIIYVPFLANIFHVKPLSFWMWIEILVILVILFVSINIAKLIKMKVKSW